MAQHPRSKTLTSRQEAVYLFIRNQILQQHIPPTLWEMCHHFAWTNPNSARNYINTLERKGLIVRAPGVFRGIRLTEDLNRSGIGTLNPSHDGTRYDFSKLFEEPEHFVVVAGDDAHTLSPAINAGDHCIMARSKKPKLGDVVAVDHGAKGVLLQQYTKGLKVAGALAAVIRVL